MGLSTTSIVPAQKTLSTKLDLAIQIRGAVSPSWITKVPNRPARVAAVMKTL